VWGILRFSTGRFGHPLLGKIPAEWPEPGHRPVRAILPKGGTHPCGLLRVVWLTESLPLASLQDLWGTPYASQKMLYTVFFFKVCVFISHPRTFPRARFIPQIQPRDFLPLFFVILYEFYKFLLKKINKVL